MVSDIGLSLPELDIENRLLLQNMSFLEPGEELSVSCASGKSPNITQLDQPFVEKIKCRYVPLSVNISKKNFTNCS